MPLVNRVVLATGPILWTLTGIGGGLLLGLVIRRLRTGTSFGRDASRPVVLAAAAVAVCSIAQIMELATPIAFGAVAWAAPDGHSTSISRGGRAALQLSPLFATCALLVIALVLRRGLALQRDVDGLVCTDGSAIHCRFDELLAERGMMLARRSDLVGVTVVKPSILENDRARAIRCSTLDASCDALDCEIAELLTRRG